MASVLRGIVSVASNAAAYGYEKVKCGKREDAEAPKTSTITVGGDSYLKRVSSNETVLRAAKVTRVGLSWLPLVGRHFEKGSEHTE